MKKKITVLTAVFIIIYLTTVIVIEFSAVANEPFLTGIIEEVEKIVITEHYNNKKVTTIVGQDALKNNYQLISGGIKVGAGIPMLIRTTFSDEIYFDVQVAYKDGHSDKILIYDGDYDNSSRGIRYSKFGFGVKSDGIECAVLTFVTQRQAALGFFPNDTKVKNIVSPYTQKDIEKIVKQKMLFEEVQEKFGPFDIITHNSDLWGAYVLHDDKTAYIEFNEEYKAESFEIQETSNIAR